MKTQMAVLTLVALLAGGGPAMAQSPGTADPLGLINVGAVVPFFGSGGNQAYLELTSPLGPNGVPTPGTNPVHIRFFRADCSASNSLDVPMSINDMAFLTLSDTHAGLARYDGLAVIAGSSDGLTLSPLSNPIHARSHWVNFTDDYVRVVEPIAIAITGGAGVQTWNPLRPAATFWAPRDTHDVQTTLVLICPSTVITGCGVSAGGCGSALSSIIQGAPALTVASARPLGTSDTNGVIRGVVYDDDELSLRDITFTCDCVTIRRVIDIDAVYGSTTEAANGTYTEIRGGEPAAGDRTFTGYRAIRIFSPQTLDEWGRLSNASSLIIDGLN